MKFRPTYPPAAVDAVLDGLGLPSGLLAADVGAGTGISARLLADRGCRVIAIEPNRAMRDAAEPHQRVEWRDGSAEDLGLHGESIDLVIAAQAFHWFRPTSALAEFARVLRPGGRLALVWNLRDNRDAFTAGYTAALFRTAIDDAVEKDLQTDSLAACALYQTALRLEFEGVPQSFTAEGLLGRALSSSYVPRSGPAHATLISDLNALHAAHADTQGRVQLRYRTEVWLARRL